MSTRPSYLQPINDSMGVLVAGMNPPPLAYYIQYKLVQDEDIIAAVSKSHQDDEETEVVGDDLEVLIRQIEDRVTDGVSVFASMEPGSDLYEYPGGPFKFVRELVLVFDLDAQEQAEVERLRAERDDD